MPMSSPSPLQFEFVTRDDDDKKRERKFTVQEWDLDRVTRFLVVVPERGGCLTVSFDPRKKGVDHVVTIESVAHDPACADECEGLPRKYGTRSMILGTLNVLKTIARKRYPHLQTIELKDEGSYPRRQWPDADADGELFPLKVEDVPPYAIETFAIDLLLHGETFYERHLKVIPCREITKIILETVKRRVSRPVDVSFSAFWKALTGDVARYTERNPEQLRWLDDHEAIIREKFERHGTASWRTLFRALHEAYDCAFFSCCWWRLCILFSMTRLVGAAWGVSFDQLPHQAFTIHQGGGGGGGFRGEIDEKVDRAIKAVISRKLRGRWRGR